MMLCFRCRHRLNPSATTGNKYRVLLYLVVGVFFTVETLPYAWAAFVWWRPLECSRDDDGSCTRVLLVADPQLTGPHDAYAPISMWDSDRYLAKTYAYVHRFTRPHVVIFLGDLFDEGSRSSDKEFEIYVRRFEDIFFSSRGGRDEANGVLVSETRKQQREIVLPGDNDIGGEGFDIITKDKVERFERRFVREKSVALRNVRFVSVNPLLGSFSDAGKIEPQRSGDGYNEEKDYVAVALSHLPLLTMPTLFVRKVLQTSKVRLLFTAHDHAAAIITTNSDMQVINITKIVDTNRVFEYNDDNQNLLHEFSVPTCSYRMGTKKIGYGFAVIDGATVRYTVLWTPSRFAQLYFYFLVGAVCLLFVCVDYCCCRGSKRSLFSQRMRLTPSHRL